MGWGGSVLVGWYLVDQTCWQVSLRWPLEVSMDAGRCLRTNLEVRPVQVAKYPESMVLHQVSTTGLKQALCRNWTREGSVLMW